MLLSTEYPLWLALLCLLLAAGGTALLYRGNRLSLEGPYAAWVKRALMAFRFIALFVISFLLLGPLLKLTLRKTEKPYVIFALDNSQSIVALKDSAFYRKEFPALMQSLQRELADYEVRSYVFDKDVKEGSTPDYSGKQTDVSKVFDKVNEAYAGQNIGAVILASDGIYNEGSNPLYARGDIKAPVYSIALGDSSQHKDLLISHVRYNQLSYLGNEFPLEVELKAFACAGSSVDVSITHNGQQTATKRVPVQGNNFFSTVPFSIEAKQEGTQHYTITVTHLPGEATYINNRFDVFVNVISGRQKVLIIANAPHPDIAALRESLEQNENYRAEVVLMRDVNSSTVGKDISLVVLHQLPGLRGEGSALIKQLNEKRMPLLYVLGAQTDPNQLNALEPSINISSNRLTVNDALPLYDAGFSSFTIDETELEHFKKLPPLLAPFGTYRISGETDVLFRQQIGYVKTEYPLVFFSRREGQRKGFICGEGLWKWRLYDFNISKQQTVNTLLSKMVQYLATREDKGRFRISGKKRFDENEHIVLDAEVYNESYELINTPEVTLNIRDAKGRQYPFTFSRNGRSYTVDAGVLPTGNYSYEGRVTNGGKTEVLKGQLTVMPLQVEFTQTVADHQLLNELATQSGGQLFYPSQAKALAEAIRKNENIRPVIYQQDEMKSWINLKWIFFVLLTLMSVEWFIRKWNGGV